jgi:hypothetical protein
MKHTFLSCLHEYRKKHGIPGGKAPKKGSAEYQAVMKMMECHSKKAKKDGKM